MCDLMGTMFESGILQRAESSEVPPKSARALALATFGHALDLAAGGQVFYSELDDVANRGSFAAEVRHRAAELNPQRLILLEPGDCRVQQQLGTLGLHPRDPRRPS